MLNSIKKTLAVTMTGVLTVSSVLSFTTDANAAVKSKLSKTNLTLSVGQVKKLTLKNATGKVTWKSSKKSVATVSSKGVVTAGKVGEATITAVNNKSKYTCKVTVKNKVSTFRKKATKVYITEESTMPVNIYFRDGGDIPYVNLSEFIGSFLAPAIADDAPGFKLECKTKGSTVSLNRDNGSYATVDFDKNTVYFPNLDKFRELSVKDFFGVVLFKGGSAGLFKKDDSSYIRYGNEKTIDFDDYGVPTGTDGKNYYIPLQSFCDIFFFPFMGGGSLLYNGESLFYCDGELSEGMSKLYYGVKKTKLSKEFVNFNYGELCLGLDLNYGLKDIRRIRNFDSFFNATGLTEKLLDYDNRATSIDTALYTMINYYIDDIHTSYSSYSPYSDYNGDEKAYQALKDMPHGVTKQRSIDTYDELEAAYNKYYPNGAKVYEEVGDTAYIRFNNFMLDGTDDYMSVPTYEEVKDEGNTIRLMQYAYDHIMANKNLKRVVLDLSMNGGGNATTALYVIGTFLGKGTMTCRDTITDAMCNSAYMVDTNRDGVFDDKDTLQSSELKARGLKLYCFISNFSFSCGNIVPCMFKDSKKVTLIGQTTGGGATSVGGMSTATGTSFNISSPYVFSFEKNGSFYDTDRGAEPEFWIKDLSKLYDRVYMNTFLDKID